MENDEEEEVLFEDDISEEAQKLLENGENVFSSTSHRPARKRAPEPLPNLLLSSRSSHFLMVDSSIL